MPLLVGFGISGIRKAPWPSSQRGVELWWPATNTSYYQTGVGGCEPFISGSLSGFAATVTALMAAHVIPHHPPANRAVHQIARLFYQFNLCLSGGAFKLSFYTHTAPNTPSRPRILCFPVHSPCRPRQTTIRPRQAAMPTTRSPDLPRKRRNRTTLHLVSCPRPGRLRDDGAQRRSAMHQFSEAADR